MADISKIQIESGVYDIKDTTARSDINTINTNLSNINNKLTAINLLKNKKVMIIGDSLDITGRWGTYFITYSGCTGVNYGNGSAGFTSQGITSPFENMTFVQMLNSIIGDMTTTEKNELEYLIVAGGINDALNNHTPESITSAVETFITTAKTNLPNAKLIIFPLHTFTWLEPINLQRYQAIIDTCKNNGVMTTGDFLFWTIDNNTYDNGDHIHLTDLGYQNLAYRILSYINGTTNAEIENIEYTLSTNWEIYQYFHMYKKDNIVYVTGVLHYTGGTISSASDILTITKGSLLTGTSNYNKYLPTLYYSGGGSVLCNVNVYEGRLRTGLPVNYNALSNPYLYINGSFVVGIK